VHCCTEAAPAPHPATLRLLLLTVTALWRAGGACAAEPTSDPAPCNEPLCYTASRLEAERNRIVLYDIDIVDTTRGVSRIKAGRAEATGLDLGSSQWVLTGNVQVFLPEGQLHADKATVQFASKRIGSMTAEGAPAQFEHKLDNGQTAHGHARVITFDMEHNDLQLNGDGWLSDGCNEISSSHIAYDLATQRVRADSAPGDNAQVRGTIRTGAANQCASATSRP
jgi:lipopolysaccharide transport protein LptA